MSVNIYSITQGLSFHWAVVGVEDGSAVTMSPQYEYKLFSLISQQNKVYIPSNYSL